MSQDKNLYALVILTFLLLPWVLCSIYKRAAQYKRTLLRPNPITTNPVISWDEYFMSISYISAMRSKDPSKQVGACIVDHKNRIVSIGYNGLPFGCSDHSFPWVKSKNWLDSKYPYVCHAEANAILNTNGKSIENCKMYTTLFPCNECTKLRIQSGIKTVYYNEYKQNDATRASKRMLDATGIVYCKFISDKSLSVNLKKY